MHCFKLHRYESVFFTTNSRLLVLITEMISLFDSFWDWFWVPAWRVDRYNYRLSPVEIWLPIKVLAFCSLVGTRDFLVKVLSLYTSVVNGTGVCFRSWFDLFKRNEEWKFKTQWSVTFSRKRRSISSYRYISLSHNGCDDRKFQEWFFTTGEKKPAEAF